ncbi:MAG: glycosyltransferase family 39 protein [Rhodoferax sp.]
MPTSASVAPFHFSRPARLWLLTACLVHALLGALVGLSVDEAHYALYAVHLDWSYFDHPPLVGWLQWPLVALGAPVGVMRLVAEALWLLAAVLVHGLALRLQGSQTPVTPARGDAGAWAVAVMALSPLLHVLGIGLLPDTLLMALASAVMWVTLDLREAAALHRCRFWVVLGLLLGLAGLSKYTAILWALAVALCLLNWHGVRVLRQPGLWLAVLLAAVCIMPVLGWNYQHQWISFAYQLQHGSGGGWQGAHILRFAVVQLLAYGPLFLAAWLGVRQDATVGVRSLTAFFLLPWGVLAVMAGGGTSLPHWTAPAWVCLAPFAGLGLAAVRARQWLRTSLAGLQALTCTVLLGLMVTAGQPLLTQAIGQGNSAQPSNPFADVHGWDRAGARARELAQQEGLPSVSVQNWTLASRLGWYARPLPVHVLEDRFDQFTLWAGPLPAGAATLLVDWSQLGYEVPVGAHGFTDCVLRDTLQVQRLGATIATFRFYACKGWSGAPQPRLQGAS